ncbi:class I SAM-dependent methyltransferase [Microbulbifer yueqingensis]|uniref:16S rRNA m(2)G 1207 methyltransferase n=1 Tax=Microbulbifer yueqingensis TaxID=658219 RepID=A0A1G9AB17_9GAMM|nr:methyltransferase [Microbulbifer yueqingensis]SDK24552.1 16S rRNA m(2)G 1207 methyltransferase [Microbulbifer yueqingensis]
MPHLLQQLLQENPRETLWIAEENSKALLQAGFRFDGDLITNRWDIAHFADGRCHHSFFSDFRFAELERRYRRIVFPVSKEKAIVHHVINSTPEVLGAGGELALLGGKQSGIKTYAAKAAARLGGDKNLVKHGLEYSCQVVFHESDGQRLDDQDYTRLRPLDALGGLYSKPGLFGWNKIDRGSALLADRFAEHLPPPGANVVDLGCGYGYLSAELARHGTFHFTATDNNAAALLACERNFREREITGVVTPSDAGRELGANIADLLICNPPFHQGFQVEGDLTDRFLENAARLLRPGGTALFVVNEFIPLARKAEPLFTDIQPLERRDGFSTFRLCR